MTAMATAGKDSRGQGVKDLITATQLDMSHSLYVTILNNYKLIHDFVNLSLHIRFKVIM